MRKTIRTEIPYWRLVELDTMTTKDIIERFRYIIMNRVVFHNDQLNVDFVVHEVCVHENIKSMNKELDIVIEILEDNDVYYDLLRLEDHLNELLPTKRREKCGAKEV